MLDQAYAAFHGSPPRILMRMYYGEARAWAPCSRAARAEVLKVLAAHGLTMRLVERKYHTDKHWPNYGTTGVRGHKRRIPTLSHLVGKLEELR